MEAQKKKKLIIIICAVLAVLIAATVIIIPSLYVEGLLGSCRPLNEAKDRQIKVACVGDSITFGAGITGWQRNTYPVFLGNLLGDGYCVNNYGFSGRTAMYDGDFPLVNEKLFDKSLEFNPDVVILMLGSNDSKPQNWKGAEAYKRDLTKIIDRYKALESSPRIYLLAPPPVWEKGDKVLYDIKKDVIANEIHPAVAQLAAEINVNYVDMYAAFDGHPEYFSDGIHPNKAGAKYFAEKIYAVLSTADLS